MKAYAENSFDNKTVVQYIHSLVNDDIISSRDCRVLLKVLGHLIDDAATNVHPTSLVRGDNKPKFNVRSRVGRYYAIVLMDELLQIAKIKYRKAAVNSVNAPNTARNTQSIYERYRFLYNFIRYGKNVIILGTDY